MTFHKCRSPDLVDIWARYVRNVLQLHIFVQLELKVVITTAYLLPSAYLYHFFSAVATCFKSIVQEGYSVPCTCRVRCCVHPFELMCAHHLCIPGQYLWRVYWTTALDHSWVWCDLSMTRVTPALCMEVVCSDKVWEVWLNVGSSLLSVASDVRPCRSTSGDVLLRCTAAWVLTLNAGLLLWEVSALCRARTAVSSMSLGCLFDQSKFAQIFIDFPALWINDVLWQFWRFSFHSHWLLRIMGIYVNISPEDWDANITTCPLRICQCI